VASDGCVGSSPIGATIMELTLEQYLEREKRFFDKYDEYIRKLIAINKSENDSNEEECVEKRKALKKEYEGYTSIYHCDFFTELTQSYIDTHPGCVNAPKILKEVEKNKGRKFFFGDKICTMTRAIVGTDDYYYELVDNKQGRHYYTCVGFPTRAD
jgi:hypothetical protein